MPKISLKKWKSILTCIIEQLDKSQYKKMLEYLEKIPKHLKTDKCRENMAQKIIEGYGEKKSILLIKRVMEKIPRRDSAVQDLLQPFVALVGILKDRKVKVESGLPFSGSCPRDPIPDKQHKNNGRMDGRSCPTKQRNSIKKRKTAQDGCLAEQKANPVTSERCLMRKTISDLISSGNIEEHQAVVGKVVQKTKLCTYKTKDGKERMFFYLAVADETGYIKAMVYGKERHAQIKIGGSFLFRKLKMEENVLKVFTLSTVSETNAVEVPKKVEMAAETLLYHEEPVSSIAQVKTFPENTSVSVQGVVTEINRVMKTNKTRRQIFSIKDDTDSIDVCMWEKETLQCKGISPGDAVKVTGLKTRRYYEVTSLNSTGSTRIHQVRRADVQTGRIEIRAVTRANKTSTHIEAEFNRQLQAFVVSSRRLAKVFGFTPDAELKRELLLRLPLSASAEIQGNKIMKFEPI